MNLTSEVSFLLAGVPTVALRFRGQTVAAVRQADDLAAMVADSRAAADNETTFTLAALAGQEPPAVGERVTLVREPRANLIYTVTRARELAGGAAWKLWCRESGNA